MKTCSIRYFAMTFGTVKVTYGICKVLGANATKQDGSKFENMRHLIIPLYVR